MTTPMSGPTLPLLLCLTFASAAVTAQSQTTYPETVLHTFLTAPTGANPCGNLVRDPAGNIYGTTEYGGAHDQGVVFKVDAAGHQKVLYSFTGQADGANPRSGVVSDSQGNLYGTTYFGGTAGMGVVYKLDTSGNETVLHSFTGGLDGKAPIAGVLLDPAGYIYGTTYYGGAGSSGVVYKLDPAGHYTVLYSFAGGTDGRNPYAGLARDSAGNLYGTTEYGGGDTACSYLGCGTVFKVDTAGHETVLHGFTYGIDGIFPQAGVLLDAAGNLYGTTLQSGSGLGLGTVYKLDNAGVETSLYSFTGNGAGGSPSPGDLIRDPAGNLYGTTSGGAADSFAGLGVVYKLAASGQETVLYTFAGGAAGSQPQAGVTRDSAGNLYGTANGGTAGAGIVYELDPEGQLTPLYAFPMGVGYNSYAGVVRDAAGNLYGTTYQGGPANAGAVYKLDAAGRYTMLYGFTGGADGSNPMAGVVRDPAGNLYGTTQYGGATGAGVVYKLDPAGRETVLHSFTGSPDGAYPTAGVIRDSAGNLYGATPWGGASGGGVVYKVDPSGQETVLYSFNAVAGGFSPYSGVIEDPDGNLYGTTCCGGSGEGVVYKLDPSGQETVLYNFVGGSQAGSPTPDLTRDGAGNLYGTTNYDGPGNGGVVFKLDTAGNFAILYSFTGGADGGFPEARVILDAAGNLYGTTTAGGVDGHGVVYKLDTAGQETVLHAFTGGADGGSPYAGLIFDPAGNLYGTTTAGGNDTVGVVFKLSGAGS
ncbi:MAG: choice-of-anchor tandem repeat GloVer-containing protein [Bryobacteraceae bacterium]|jgi:uncharacterized repeat protein (TIGR03803 family)